MYLVLNEFIVNYAVRNHLYLASPTLTHEDSLKLPRHLTIHYLDLNSDAVFPTPYLSYLKDVPKNKKIPVLTVLELDKKEGVGSLLNKYLPADHRRWQRENIAKFREVDLELTQPKDINTPSVVNYNGLKGLYNYKDNPLSKHYRHLNLASTYWDKVKKLSASEGNIQLVTFDVPGVIPSRELLDRIAGYSELKQQRIVNTPSLRWTLDLYLWLNGKTRDKTPITLTDEESANVLVEFRYRGYSAFMFLSTLRMLAVDSPLKSSLKIDQNKLNKLFLNFLNNVRNKATSIINGQDFEETTDNKEEELPIEEDDVDDVEVIEDKPVEIAPIDEPPSSIEDVPGLSGVVSKAIPVSGNRRQVVKELKKLDIKSASFDETSFLDMLDKDDSRDSAVDDLFLDAISRADNEPIVEPKPKGKVTEDPEVTAEKVNPLKIVPKEEAKALLVKQDKTVSIGSYLERTVAAKTVSTTKAKSIRKALEMRLELPDPYSGKEKLDLTLAKRPRDIQLTKEKTEVKVTSKFVNKNFQRRVLRTLEETYLDKMYRNDILACISAIEQDDIIIKGYEIEEVKNSVDNYEIHKLTLKPIDGDESTIYLRIPKIDSDGIATIAGNQYKLRKVLTDLPIRKISPIKVAITSDAGKLFLGRTERKTNDPGAYFIKFIQTDYLGDQAVIKKVVPGKKKLNEKNLPNIYNILSSEFNSVVTKDYDLHLNLKTATNHIKPEVLAKITKDGYVYAGSMKGGHILTVGFDDTFYKFDGDYEPVGKIEDILELDQAKVPKEFSTLKVLGDDIPLGVVMSYYLGISGLLSVTGAEHKVLGPREQYKAGSDEVVIRFEDHKLVVKTTTTEHKLLFNGFLFYKDTTKRFPLSSFDSKDVYLMVIEQRGSGLIHLKEMNNLRARFIDPITADTLAELGQPTEFLEVLLYANKLLDDFKHPEINDTNYARIRGYDRVPGLMYRAINESVREFKLKGRSNAKIAIDPYKVWNYITQDSTIKAVEDVNPILNCKESEALTLTGRDGLSKDVTPIGLRRYNPNQTGLISESTVDSADVALNIYLSPYAKIKSLRGIVDTENTDAKDNPAMLYSTASMVSPIIDHDDQPVSLGRNTH